MFTTKTILLIILLNVVHLYFPIVISAQITINELLPNPPGNDTNQEWIELYNNSTSTLDLAGFRLTDKANQSFFIDSSHTSGLTTINSHSYILIYPYGVNKFSLNNSGDETISLFSSASSSALLVDSFSYNNSSENVSYGRLPDGVGEWSPNLNPTPNQPNSSPTTPSPSPTSSSTPTPTPTPKSSSSTSSTLPSPSSSPFATHPPQIKSIFSYASPSALASTSSSATQPTHHRSIPIGSSSLPSSIFFLFSAAAFITASTFSFLNK